MPKSQQRRKKFYTGVTLDPEVVAYLDGLAVRTNWNRSLVLNAVVRRYAELVEDDGTGPSLAGLMAGGTA